MCKSYSAFEWIEKFPLFALCRLADLDFAHLILNNLNFPCDLKQNGKISFYEKNDKYFILNINLLQSVDEVASALIDFREELTLNKNVNIYYIDFSYYAHLILPKLFSSDKYLSNELKIDYETPHDLINFVFSENNSKKSILMKFFSYSDLQHAILKSGYSISNKKTSYTKKLDLYISCVKINTPLESMAINSYKKCLLNQKENFLDLRWSPDEKNFLDLDVSLNSHVSNKLESIINSYNVHDPYSSNQLFRAASKFFENEITEDMIITTPGVSSALFYLSKLINFSVVACPHYSYPDMAIWQIQNGNQVLPIDLNMSQNLLEEYIAINKIRMILIDNPNFLGNFVNIETIELLSHLLHKNKGYLLIDESNGNYLPISKSFVRYLDKISNLIICRGFSKGYCMGGLRLGIILFNSNLETLIKNCVPILQTSSLSTYLAEKILEKGDIFNKLRGRITEVKNKFIKLLTINNFKPISYNAYLPWVLLQDFNENIYNQLLEKKILSKQQKFFYFDENIACDNYIRLSIPLSDDRIQQAWDKWK